MSDLGVVESLRPLVETHDWDFAVVWKYGDDPTRFIEWLGCCCRGSSCGGNRSNEKVKLLKVKDEHYKLDPCRDTHSHHPLRTKACQALSHLPSVISLYSGTVHGEVAISQQPRWLNQEKEKEIGTQVLIPIPGGLVELSAAKLIPKDVNIIEYITAHCCISLKQGSISAAQSYSSGNKHLPSEEQYQQMWSPLVSMSTLTSNVNLHAANWFNSHASIELPSCGSNPSSEYPSFDSMFDPNEYLLSEYQSQSVETTPTPETKSPKGKQQRGSSTDPSGDDGEDRTNLFGEHQKNRCRSKNLVTERKRRNRLKKGLFTLRSLVPNITKMDRASILGDAIDYIKELLGQMEELKDEVKTLGVEGCQNMTELRMSKGKAHVGTRSLPLTELNQSSSDCTKQKEMKVQAEVNHIGGKDWFIKLYCEQKPGGLSRLMEVIHSYGLQVENANVTTVDGKVMIILEVEATEQDIKPMKLKEYLREQTS